MTKLEAIGPSWQEFVREQPDPENTYVTALVVKFVSQREELIAARKLTAEQVKLRRYDRALRAIQREGHHWAWQDGTGLGATVSVTTMRNKADEALLPRGTPTRRRWWHRVICRERT